MLIRDGGGGGTKHWRHDVETARKRPERPWTAARTTEMLRRCPLAIAQRLVHCAVAVSTAVLGQSHKDNVRCTAVKKQPEAKEVQLSQPSSTSLLMISSGLTWGSSSTSLLLISLGTLWLQLSVRFGSVVLLNVLGCRSVDILGTSWDQCRSMVQYCFTSTETIRLVRTDSPGWPPQLSHSSWTMSLSVLLIAFI